MTSLRKLWIATGGLGLLAVTGIQPVYAGNIIKTDNPGTCGGAVICSTNGTTGYLNNGTGQAFDLSTIDSWFQIDQNGVNELPTTQTMPEPDAGAGAFLVLNDTGQRVTQLTLNLTDTFNASTAGDGNATQCSPNGQPCQNFSAQIGSLAAFNFSQLSGPEFDSCTTGMQIANTCNNGSGSNAAAWFSQNQVTYSWSGDGVASGAMFDISFASWPNGNSAFITTSKTPVPEPGTLALFGSGLLMLGWLFSRRKKSGLTGK